MYPIYKQLRERHATPSGNESVSRSSSAGGKLGGQGNSSSGTNQGGANISGTPSPGSVSNRGRHRGATGRGGQNANDRMYIPLVHLGDVPTGEDDSPGNECESNGKELFLAIHRAIAAKYLDSIYGSIANFIEQQKAMALNEKISR